MPERRNKGRSLAGVILSLISEFWSFLLFSWLTPRTNHVDERGAQDQERDVNSVAKAEDRADHPLVPTGAERHLEIRSVEGMVTGREDQVSDEFLSQLEQRTQQVKITLANLEAEKVRIEGLIAQLQPLVPHYDALVTAERQINEANISLEPSQAAPQDTPPAESSGWASDAPGDQQGSGWSGSWNS
ncbi:MAG TPA: hypothetical protein VJP07_07465 [Dehalococcoidia bacterium]|nr:hypothetical protein [Dehalococcoidia bacterium]